MKQDNRQPKPLILRMAKPQQVPGAEDRPTRYDETLDELLVLVGSRWIPAVDSPGGGPKTKKADVETGEDQKDRW